MITNNLNHIPLFASCSEAELKQLLEKPHKVSTHQPGEMLIRFGTPCRSLLLLTEGEVESRMGSVEGRELVVDRLKAPCVLAPAFLFGSNNIFIGSVTRGKEQKEFGEGFCELFRKGGITATYTDDIDREVWYKLLMNIAVNASCGLVRLRGGEAGEAGS